MTVITRLWRWLLHLFGRRQTTPAILPRLGIVVHGLTPVSAQVVAALGCRSVLISEYPGQPAPNDMASQVSAAHGAKLAPLLITYSPITPEYLRAVASLAPDAMVVCGNEPVDLTAAAAMFRALRYANPQSPVRLLPPGIDAGKSPAQIAAAVAAGLGDAGVLLIHAYGWPEQRAVERRLAEVRTVWQGGIWITEFGASSTGITTQARQLAAAYQAMAGVECTYLYALVDDTEGYTLTPETLAWARYGWLHFRSLRTDR